MLPRICCLLFIALLLLSSYMDEHLLLVTSKAVSSSSSSTSKSNVPKNKVAAAKQLKGKNPNSASSEDPTKPKSAVNPDLLPKLTDVMEEIKMMHHLPKLLKMGVVDCRTLIRLVDMDFRIMQFDHSDVTNAEITAIKAKIEEIRKAATVILAPPRFDLDERKTLKYGRVYIENGVQSFDYLRASFGASPPLGSYPYKVAQAPDEDGCVIPDNLDLTGHVYIVKRGGCSYLAKALLTEAANAAALIVVNIEDVIEAPSSGYGIDPVVRQNDVVGLNHFPVLQTSNTSWTKFLLSERYNGTIDMVPLKCGSNGTCLPTTPEERSILAEVMYGTLALQDDPSRRFEFLTSNYGGALPFDDTPLALVLAEPRDGCQPLTNNNISPDELTAVVVLRGNCRFDIKSLNAQEAGAKVLIVVDVADNALQRIGGQAPQASYIGLPSMIVGPLFFEYIQSKPAAGLKLLIDAGRDNHEETVADWAELVHFPWSERLDERLAQVEAALTKFKTKNGVNIHIEIVNWLTRKRIDLVQRLGTGTGSSKEL